LFIRTPNLFLRPVFTEDWRAIYCGIADLRVVSMLASAPWPYLPKHAREFVMRQHDPRYPVFLVTLPTGSGSEVIGCIGIDPCDSADAEIGYWIARPHWGQGYASEAGRGALEVARLLGHQRIEAGHFVDNPASGRVLRKIGFLPTGRVAPRASRARGGEAPCKLFSLDLRADARARPQAA